MNAARRVSFVYLALVPFIVAVLSGIRGLRIPMIYHAIGTAHLVVILAGMWVLGLRTLRSSTDVGRGLVAGGVMLQAPFALMAWLWVGLGPPWQANGSENFMRYMVLLVGAVAVTGGFVALHETLRRAGETFYSTLGFAASILAGSAYLVWLSFMLGAQLVRAREGQLPAPFLAMSDVTDVLLFVACALTYVATGMFSAAFRRSQYLGRCPSRAYILASSAALVFLILRGLAFPNPTSGSTPWYTQPGFIAGIPAVPWIMPALLGVVVLRRAGNEPVTTRTVND